MLPPTIKMTNITYLCVKVYTFNSEIYHLIKLSMGKKSYIKEAEPFRHLYQYLLFDEKRCEIPQLVKSEYQFPHHVKTAKL